MNFQLGEIYSFKIHQADAAIIDGGLTVRLHYPEKPQIIERQLAENLEFGAEVFERLTTEGYSAIANAQNPIKPASAGSAIRTSDGKIICHRRDRFAPSHPIYHGISVGFTNTREGVYTAEGLEETAMRESAEETLLVTRGEQPWLVVPKDCEKDTLESAKRLGIDLPTVYVDVEREEPTDTLEVYDHNGSLIFKVKAFLEFLYESQASLNATQIRRLNISSEDVFPIDAEGMMKDASFVHFNRESYIMDLDGLNGSNFGEVLEKPQVFQTIIKNGIPRVYTPKYKKPFLGPDKIEVTHPHVFAPDDNLCRILDAIGIKGYKGQWMQIELWKEQAKLKGESLIPAELLK